MYKNKGQKETLQINKEGRTCSVQMAGWLFWDGACRSIWLMPYKLGIHFGREE